MKTTLLNILLGITAITANAQSNCNATFTHTNNPNGSITFTATPAVASASKMYTWDYGDLNSGYGQSATNFYTTNGTPDLYP